MSDEDRLFEKEHIQAAQSGSVISQQQGQFKKRPGGRPPVKILPPVPLNEVL